MGSALNSHIFLAHISSCLILGLPQQETSSLWMEGFVQNSNSFQHLPQTTRSTPNLLRHPGQTWRISLSDLVSSASVTFWLFVGKEKTAKQGWCRGAAWWHVAVLERKLMNMTSNLSAPRASPLLIRRREAKFQPSGWRGNCCSLKQLRGSWGLFYFSPPDWPHFIVGFQDHLAMKFVDLKVEPSFVPFSNFILVNRIN